MALTAVGMVVVVAAGTGAGMQAPGGELARTVDGRPDLNGFWQALGTAHWDVQDHVAQAGPPQLGAIGAIPGGFGVVVGDTIPYQPWAARQKQENFENRWTADPEIKCYLPGVPRATYLPYPFQIVQSTNKVMIIYEFARANRTIHLDEVPPMPVDTWMGHSVGRWEGDTLVVTVNSFRGDTWFDRAGNFHSNALQVVERYTAVGSNHLDYEVTIEDPQVFTRSWTMRMPLYRRMDERMRLFEYRCVPFSEELIYGQWEKR
jgi:hypothetical protein